MAQRKHKLFRKVDSTEVQGEGSYVILKAMTFGDMKVYAGYLDSSDKTEQYKLGYDLLKSLIMEWNWVDDDGKPLSLPKDDDAVLDLLPIEELTFLTDAMGAGVKSREAEKN